MAARTATGGGEGGWRGGVGRGDGGGVRSGGEGGQTGGGQIGGGGGGGARTEGNRGRCRANSAHIRQSRPDSDLCVKVEVLNTF